MALIGAMALTMVMATTMGTARPCLAQRSKFTNARRKCSNPRTTASQAHPTTCPTHPCPHMKKKAHTFSIDRIRNLTANPSEG